MQTIRSLFFTVGLSLVVSSTLACGGEVGTERRPAPDPRSPSSTLALTFSEQERADALAACSTPHGPVEKYTTVDQLIALLSSNWIYCPDDAGPLPAQSGRTRTGLEFTGDGHFYWLTEDGQKGISRGTGIEGAAAYEITPPMSVEYNDVSFQIDVIYADRSTMSLYATFESEPRRLKLTNFDGYFVPLAKGTM